MKSNSPNVISIDVEDWFHILDNDGAPPIEQWAKLESHIVRNVEVMLAMLDSFSVKATFFWLGWAAERHKSLVRKCHNSGHEIASYRCSHVPAYNVGTKKLLEWAGRNMCTMF